MGLFDSFSGNKTPKNAETETLIIPDVIDDTLSSDLVDTPLVTENIAPLDNVLVANDPVLNTGAENTENLNDILVENTPTLMSEITPNGDINLAEATPAEAVHTTPLQAEVPLEPAPLQEESLLGMQGTENTESTTSLLEEMTPEIATIAPAAALTMTGVVSNFEKNIDALKTAKDAELQKNIDTTKSSEKEFAEAIHSAEEALKNLKKQKEETLKNLKVEKTEIEKEINRLEELKGNILNTKKAPTAKPATRRRTTRKTSTK